MSLARINQIKSMRQQCKSLNQFYGNDDSMWYIQLVDKNMQELYKILLTLPKDFPNVAPQISVSQLLDHPWVDPAVRTVRHPTVVGWNPKCDVGTVILDVLREFTTKKPTLIPDNNTPRGQTTVKPADNDITVPAVFPGLNDLPLEYLQKMDEDDSLLNDFVKIDTN